MPGFNPPPPQEAMSFFRKKGYQTSFSWQDMWQEEHARAFTVAKAMRLDILEDIRQEVDRALVDGLTERQFKENLSPRLMAKGWWGKGLVFDPQTGQMVMSQLGSSRRLGIIFDTNMRMARAAGQWERIQRSKERRPYLMYVIVDDSHTRPAHRAKYHIVLPVDHPFWDSWYPPNGWRCRCSVLQLSERDLERMGLQVTGDDELANIPTREWVNKRTGVVETIPEGISPGFNYNVGKAHMRGITPPPSSGPLRTPALVDRPDFDMPPPRTLPASYLVNPAAHTEEELIDMFVGSFGPRDNNLFIDAIGEPLLINRDFFFDYQAKRHKLAQTIRKKSVLLLAETLKDPDEIWWVWQYHEALEKWHLRRRYFARFEIDGEEHPVLMAMDVGVENWVGVTAFRPRKTPYLLRARGGVLAYRRSGEE